MQGLFVTADGGRPVMIERKYQQRLIEISANRTGMPGAPGSGPSS